MAFHIPKRSFGALSVSALDLFASALGVFILIAILMFPYYLRQPSIREELAGAEAELSAAQDSTKSILEEIASLRDERRQAERAQAAALEQLERLRVATRSAADELSQAKTTLGKQEAELRSLGERMARLAILDLDLVFVMDATGSMRDELEDIQANLLGIIRILYRLAPSLQVGFVAFKDRGDDYVVRSYDLRDMTRANLRSIVNFVNELEASGGGDRPEPVDQALEESIAMNWREEAHGKIIVISDAAAHRRNWDRTMEMADRFRQVPATALPRNISAIFTGNDRSARRFMQKLAEAGGGDFSNHKGQMIESVLLAVIR